MLEEWKRDDQLIPEYWFDKCRLIAKLSTCTRSRCGSVIIQDNNLIIGAGYNSKPLDVCGSCTKDSLPSNFKSDKTCCVHAEQRAIISAIKNNCGTLKGSTLYFIRIDQDGNMLKAGKPYCTICSKMALDVGIKWFALWHEEGIKLYDTKEYNDLSFQYQP